MTNSNRAALARRARVPQGACQYAYSVASISILLNFLLSLMQVGAGAQGRGVGQDGAGEERG